MAQCVRCPLTVPDDVLYCDICREIEIAENHAKWAARYKTRTSKNVLEQDVENPADFDDDSDEADDDSLESIPSAEPVSNTESKSASSASDDSFVQSLLLAGLSNNALYGTLLGGNAMGAIIGDLMADGKLGQEKKEGK